MSVIAFTTLSGAGYGLLVWLGVAALADLRLAPGIAWAAGIVALGLVTAGLLSSLAHLGRPARAWRALSQWRSSWLSREGVAALVAYLPALYVVVQLARGRSVPVAGALLVVACVATLYCTAQIYRSLKTVRAWHNDWTLPGYLLQAAWTGTALAWLLSRIGGAAPLAVPVTFALLSALFAAHTVAYGRWRAAQRPGDTGHATGLAHLGVVRSFERPHTEENYLLREMGFVLARKHAARLQRLVTADVGAAFVALAVAIALPALAVPAALVAVLASLSATFVERWLFFALARHVVTLYYGGDAAGQSPASSRPAPFASS